MGKIKKEEEDHIWKQINVLFKTWNGVFGAKQSKERKEKHKGIPLSTRNRDSNFSCMERRAWNSKDS